MTGRSELQQKIARDYGMSFPEVVRGLAELGYGKDTAATVLGYDKQNFRRLLQRHNNFGINWPTLQQQYQRDRNLNAKRG